MQAFSSPIGWALVVLLLGLSVGNAAAAEPYSPYVGQSHPTRVFWGDTHHHTANSGDAFTVGARLGPADAYRFARGDEIVSSSGQPARLSRPLDFLAVSDHAEGLGLGREIFAGNPALIADPIIKRWSQMLRGDRAKREAAAREIIQAQASGTLPKPITDPHTAGPIMRSVWQANNATADRFNEPGRFTALIGYEWTSVPGGNNLHRVVLFRDGADKADQILPFSSHHSEDPARLWDFLARYEAKTGGRVLAIPHNANLSNGRMFALVDFEGSPIDRQHAERRAHWEPVVEVTQIKGDGEAHPFLSPEDEFAGFGDAGWEDGNLTLEALKEPEMYAGEYAREALKRGLVLQLALGRNPFKFGMIGSTDTHTGLSAVEEASFFGKNTLYEPRAGRAMHVSKEMGGVRRYGWHYNSAGFAGVWALENTRESLFDALRRREVYATTGTRMTVRFFGGADFVAEDASAPDLAGIGYAKGVPALRRQRTPRPGRGEPGPCPDREGLRRRGWPGPRAHLRRGLGRRRASPARRRREASPGRIDRRRGASDLAQHHRRSGAGSGMARSRLRSGSPGLLLRACPRDPDAALDHLRCSALRHRAFTGGADGDPGARLHLAHLVHAVKAAGSSRRPWIEFSRSRGLQQR
jgi:hypothetical protein